MSKVILAFPLLLPLGLLQAETPKEEDLALAALALAGVDRLPVCGCQPGEACPCGVGCDCHRLPRPRPAVSRKAVARRRKAPVSERAPAPLYLPAPVITAPCGPVGGFGVGFGGGIGGGGFGGGGGGGACGGGG